MDKGVVAVIDDNITALRAMTLLFEMEGYKVVAHTSPASFLADRPKRVACLIVDQNMPGMTGLQLVAQIRQDQDHIPILLVCGILSSDIMTTAAELRIDKVLQKPVEPDTLLDAISDFSMD
jgi:two-component system response regulator FixJ